MPAEESALLRAIWAKRMDELRHWLCLDQEFKPSSQCCLELDARDEALVRQGLPRAQDVLQIGRLLEILRLIIGPPGASKTTLYERIVAPTAHLPSSMRI